MSKRLSDKKFLALAEVLFQDGPKIEYKNPDKWIV
jgi:hypothetical protein